MTSQTTTTTSTSNGSPAVIPTQYFHTTEKGSSPPATGGIGSNDSSLTSAPTGGDSTLPRVSGMPGGSNSHGSSTQVLPSTLTGPTSTSKAKCKPDPEPSSEGKVYANTAIPMKIARIFERFLVRMPHTFIAMAGTFLPLYYGLGWENFACSAATFVGVGATVYCFVRALFLEIIPEWMLARTNETKIWRRLMNITYTGFITVMFTTAVWKLPDLSTIQGLFFFGVSFGLPYIPLSKWYPDIDKQPNWSHQK